MTDGTFPDGATRQGSGVSPAGRRPARGRRRSSSRILVAAVAVVGLVLLGGGAMWGISRLGQSEGRQQDRSQKLYETVGAVALRQSASNEARTIATLREGTRVAGTSAGTADGVAWVQVTAIDGAKGFVPSSDLREVAATPGSQEQLIPGSRRILTSTLVNLRASPSLSAPVVGVADGGTRLVSDASMRVDGETWLRVPLNAETTVWIAQRFTTADEETAGGDEGIETQSGQIGVAAAAKSITNVLATPLPDARVVRSLQEGEAVRVLGQTFSGGWWYVLRLPDGSQGFAPRDSIQITQQLGRWVYPDGTEAPGPNVPQGSQPHRTRSGDSASRNRRQQDGGRGAEAVPVNPDAAAQAAAADATPEPAPSDAAPPAPDAAPAPQDGAPPLPPTP